VCDVTRLSSAACCRHVQEANGHRLKRRLKVMRAQSTVQVPLSPLMMCCSLTLLHWHTSVRCPAALCHGESYGEHSAALRPGVSPQELERDVRSVRQKLRATAADAQQMAVEQKDLERTRQAQVALSTAWQPEAVRSRQQQLLAQTPIEPQWRIAALQHARADAEVRPRGF